MALEGSYSFAGIGAAEAKDRENETRTGVPPAGAGLTALLSVPALRTTGVRAVNQGEADALLALAHGRKETAVTGEYLVGAFVSTTVYRGKLQFGSIKPKSVSITAGAGPTPLTDPAGDGVLKDAALVARGTINYRTGAFSITFASAVTEPVVAAYTHTDYVQFTSPTQTKTQAAAAVPFVMAASFGRVVPRTVSMTDGVVTVVDDGKGNMVETTTTAVKRGTIDYATGVVTLTTISVPLVGTVTMTFKFNPFAALLVKGGGTHGATLLSDAIPELGSEALADGLKGESRIALLGVSRDASKSTNIMVAFAHILDESYRIEEEYSGFPAGGATNDPRLTS